MAAHEQALAVCSIPRVFRRHPSFGVMRISSLAMATHSVALTSDSTEVRRSLVQFLRRSERGGRKAPAVVPTRSFPGLITAPTSHDGRCAAMGSAISQRAAVTAPARI